MFGRSSQYLEQHAWVFTLFSTAPNDCVQGKCLNASCALDMGHSDIGGDIPEYHGIYYRFQVPGKPLNWALSYRDTSSLYLGIRNDQS
eukprot:163870-Hanusia_phi.AAC.6